MIKMSLENQSKPSRLTVVSGSAFRREIKFRCWDKKMSNPFEMSEPFNPFFFGGVFSANAVFMQFTGLRDKNKKEIYEGDIIHCESENLYGLVWYEVELGRYMVTQQGGKINVSFYRWMMDPISVVGNIYENPELLVFPADR